MPRYTGSFLMFHSKVKIPQKESQNTKHTLMVREITGW